MKLFAAQIQPVTGDIPANIAKHMQLIDQASALGANLVFFPELSLTGFEPRLAGRLAMTVDDPRLTRFQKISDRTSATIGLGLPLKVGETVQIGMTWFTPGRPVRTYSKQWLHKDEHPYFTPGFGQLLLSHASHRLAPAICYESLQPEHASQAVSLGATVYLASVAKDADSVARAMNYFPALARDQQMPVILSNCLGPCDNFVTVGQSAAWDTSGDLLVRMNSRSEGGVLVDLDSGKATVHAFKSMGGPVRLGHGCSQ